MTFSTACIIETKRLTHDLNIFFSYIKLPSAGWFLFNVKIHKYKMTCGTVECNINFHTYFITALCCYENCQVVRE